MRAISPDEFFARQDERLEPSTIEPPEAMCKSCGRRPAATGFLMCAECREAVGLKTPRRKAMVHGNAGKPSKVGRTQRVCSCGFETDWPPAWAKHETANPTHFEIKEDVGVVPNRKAAEPDRSTDVETKPPAPTIEDAAEPAPPHPSPAAPDPQGETAEAPVETDYVVTDKAIILELVDCRLRLAEAMGEELPPVTRVAFVAEIERVRELVRLA